MKDRPKPLTSNRKKWEHFWYYYKIHTFVGIFIGFFMIMTVRDCSQNIDPDVSWGYMGPDLTLEQWDALTQEFLPFIQDANGDGKTHIQVYSLSDQRQIVVMMAAGDTQLFSFDSDRFRSFAENGAFLPLDDLIPVGEIDLEKFPDVRLASEESVEEYVYGLPLEGNSFLEHLGMTLEGQYLAIRIPKVSKRPEDRIVNENAVAFVQHLFSLR